METTKIALFKSKKIRKTLHNNEWWFVIVDVVAALTESTNPTQYLKNIRNRDDELSALFKPVYKGGVQIDPPLYYLFPQLVGRRIYSVGAPRAFFVLFSLSHLPKLSLLSVGWQKLAMSACRK